MCGREALFIYAAVMSVTVTTMAVRGTSAVKAYRKTHGASTSQAVAALMPASMEWVSAIVFVGAITMIWYHLLPVMETVFGSCRDKGKKRP
jgi:hypothetical protein